MKITIPSGKEKILITAFVRKGYEKYDKQTF